MQKSLEVCRYNNMHYLPKDKLVEHYEFCESAKTFKNSMQVLFHKFFTGQSVAPIQFPESLGFYFGSL